MVPATAKPKQIRGRKYDVEEKRALSFEDKSFLNCVNEFRPSQLRQFIEYILSGSTLDWRWNARGGYNDIQYMDRKGNEIKMMGNHGMTDILKGIEEGRWDPSEVVHDLAILYRGSAFEPKTERQRYYKEVAEIIREKGVTVKMANLMPPGWH